MGIANRLFTAINHKNVLNEDWEYLYSSQDDSQDTRDIMSQYMCLRFSFKTQSRGFTLRFRGTVDLLYIFACA